MYSKVHWKVLAADSIVSFFLPYINMCEVAKESEHKEGKEMKIKKK